MGMQTWIKADGGWWWPDGYSVPGHQQPAWWPNPRHINPSSIVSYMPCATSDRSSLVEMVVCRLSGGKPLFKPMIGLLAYTALGNISITLILESRLQSGGYFRLGLNVLTHADMWDQFSEPVTDNLTRVDERIHVLLENYKPHDRCSMKWIRKYACLLKLTHFMSCHVFKWQNEFVYRYYSKCDLSLNLRQVTAISLHVLYLNFHTCYNDTFDTNFGDAYFVSFPANPPPCAGWWQANIGPCNVPVHVDIKPFLEAELTHTHVARWRHLPTMGWYYHLNRNSSVHVHLALQWRHEWAQSPASW